jgi:hypothetical protein
MTSLAHPPRGSPDALEVPSNPGPEIGHEPAHKQPTRAEIMAALQAAKDAGHQIASLQEEVRQLRAEAATGVHRLTELYDVRDLPTSTSVSPVFSMHGASQNTQKKWQSTHLPMWECGQHRPPALAARQPEVREKKTHSAGSATRWHGVGAVGGADEGRMMVKQTLEDLEGTAGACLLTYWSALSGSLLT